MPPKKSPPKDVGDRIKAMIYSGYNSGKTHLLGTAGQDERTAPFFLLDFEGGTKTLDGMPGFFKLDSVTQDLPSGCTVASLRIRGWEDFNEAFERIRTNDEGLKGCGLDSASETHNYAIEQILDDEADKRKDADHVEQQDYGKALIQLRRLVREFRDLPLHFFCTAHDKEITHAQRGIIRVPNLYGKGATEIPGLLETCGYMMVDQNEAGEEMRVLLLRGYPKLDLKVRTAWGVVAPEEIEEPTVTKLLDALGYQF